MRLWNPVRSFILPAVVLGIVVGCGGDSGVKSASTKRKNNPPVVTGFLVDHGSTTGSLLQYKSYTLTAQVWDPDIADVPSLYMWDFGTGTFPVSTTADLDHVFTTNGAQTFKVRAYDSVGAASEWFEGIVDVQEAPVPIVVSFTAPTTDQSFLIDLGGYVDVLYNIHVDSTSSAAIQTSGINFSTGDTTGAVISKVDTGGGNFTITARYYAATSVGTRTATPSVRVTDVQNVISEDAEGPTLTLNTVSATNHAPTVTVTAPESPTSTGFTTKPINLGFVITDPDGDPVTYSVNWGDGSPVTTTTTSGNTVLGVAVALTHTYADSFTSGTAGATVRINATDNRSSNSNASEQVRLFNIQYNTYPIAIITTPQASATLPLNSELTGGVPVGYVNPPGANDPDIVVIPNGGKLHFIGSATPPGSGESVGTFAWTFPGGVPQSQSTPDAGEVTFNVPNGTITPILVEFRASDVYGRTAASGPGASPKTFRKWVVVDGVRTQTFQLSYMFRQKSDNNGTSTLTPAKTESNGYGSSAQIFQDGVNYTYPIQNGTGQAIVSLPVRSNLPFYAKLAAFGVDPNGYLLRIPNAPTGPFADPGLGTVLNPGQSSFGFQNSIPPYNPILQIVTGEGFAPETSSAQERRLQGVVGNGMVIGTAPANMRYLDRLSVPNLPSDSLGAIQWFQTSNNAAGFQGIRANQSFGEWVALWLNISPKDFLAGETPVDSDSTAAGNPFQDFRFLVDFGTYTSDSAKSKTFAQSRVEAFRVPPGSTDPYDLNVAGWDSPETISELNPTQISASIAPFYQNMIWGAPGTTAFSGGIYGFLVPYDANDPDRAPYSPRTYNWANIREVFSYGEYLWSPVWARPAILNRANLNYLDAIFSLGSYPFFRNSNPVAWPRKSGISPDNSAFNMNVTGARGVNPATPFFDPTTSPVGVNGAPAAATGVGRFYWTAFTPHYGIPIGAVISRTWLATETGLPPTTFSGGAGDATAALGLLTPQDVVVDKRGRNADGTLNGQPTGGYRINWFNPTVDSNRNTVPPDFWVVEVASSGDVHDFMIPSNYPAAVQSTSDLILTDARTFLPSGRSASAGPSPDGTDRVGPGYCWFDLPIELRPNVLNPSVSSTITVIALKSILKNKPPVGYRALTPADYIDAVKTVTANVKIATPLDATPPHKVPFNFYWDIVVVNGPQTIVAP